MHNQKVTFYFPIVTYSELDHINTGIMKNHVWNCKKPKC
jgi:hypothetical protein